MLTVDLVVQRVRKRGDFTGINSWSRLRSWQPNTSREDSVKSLISILIAWFFVYLGGTGVATVVGPFDNEGLCNDYKEKMGFPGKIIGGKCFYYGGS